MNYLDIPLSGSDQKHYQLRDFLGKKVILYFYPKDSTSGCTIEARDFSCHKDDFALKGYQVIGVSRDSVESHQSFVKKEDLDLLLLSDPDSLLHQAFDVMKMKSMYGKEYLGVDRSTFILDEDGNIVKSYRDVSVKDHIKQLLLEL